MKYNRNQETRDKLIWGDTDDRRECGGIDRFQNMTLETLKKLVDQNFADPEECQNDSPSIKDFIDFMENNPTVTCHGYAVHKDRSDYRVTIEGIACGEGIDVDLVCAFTQFCNGADEIVANPGHLYAWWD